MYLRPHTVEEACEALAHAPAAILSGGTDFYPGLGDRPVPDRIIDISGVAAMAGISLEAGHVRIGASTTWTSLIAADLPACFAALKLAAREVGSGQIQNVATLGGNLCNASPAADGVPPLLALDADVELASREGTRRMPLGDFLTGNRLTRRRSDELLTAILVPRTIEDGRSAFVKLGARRYLVISITMVAAIVALDGAGRVRAARAAVGSCSAVAQRLRGLEADLVGAPGRAGLGSLVRPDHLAALTPIDDIRASAAYRREASLEVVRRALDACGADA